MKCPKCGYLGFERVQRCRNCGYDFSLAVKEPSPELLIRLPDRDEDAPPGDLALKDGAPSPAQSQSPAGAVNLRFGQKGPARAPDLPLLFPALDAEGPLITRPSPPRSPLAVRRATPEIRRIREEPRASTFDWRPPAEEMPTAATQHSGDPARLPARSAPASPEVAGLLPRLCAAGVDLFVLAAIDLLVVYFTMKICGLGLADLDILPRGPLAAFLLIQNGGYLATFTAGGQTLGKMLARIKVVPARPDVTLDLGRSVVRTLVWMLLAAPAGLGFLTALGSADRRGLHDRCAGTRVVRAGA